MANLSSLFIRRKVFASITMSALVITQFVTGVFPVPVSPTGLAVASEENLVEDLNDLQDQLTDPAAGVAFDHYEGALSEELIPGEEYEVSFDIEAEDEMDVGAEVDLSLELGTETQAAQKSADVSSFMSLSLNTNHSISLPHVQLSNLSKEVSFKFVAEKNSKNFSFTSHGGKKFDLKNCKIKKTPKPKLTMEKDGPGTVAPNGSAKYELTVKNVGTGDAENVLVTDTFPTQSLSYDAGNSSSLCEAVTVNNVSVIKCTVGKLSAGKSKSFTLAFKVASTAACNSQIQNVGEAKGTNTELANDTHSTTVKCQASSSSKSSSKSSSSKSSKSSSSKMSCPNIQVSSVYGATVIANTPLELGLNAVSDVLGAPDNAVAEFASVGNQGGYVTIKFANDLQLINDSGDDLAIHIKDFLVSEDERFEVFVSQDGQNFVSLGIRNPSQSVAMQQLKLTYDIGGTGLSYVTQVKIVNIRSNEQDWEGVDIDAIEALNYKCPSSSSSSKSSSSKSSSISSSKSSSSKSSQGKPKLEIDKTGPATALPGSTIAYTVTVKNTGNGAAKNTIVTDTFPSNLTYVAGQSSPECSQTSTGKITCSAGTIEAGQSKALTLSFTVAASAQCDTKIKNIAEVDGDDCSVESDYVYTTVECEKLPELKIEKSGPGTVTPGKNLTYTIVAKNTGAGVAKSATIIDSFPSNLTFVAGQSSPECTLSAANTIQCALGDIASQQTKTISLTFTVAAAAVCDSTIVNQADLHATNGGVVGDDASTKVECEKPVITITKTSASTTVQPNGVISYTVTIKNNSQVPAQNAYVLDRSPTGASEYVTGQSSPECGQLGTGDVQCSAGTLAPNQSKTFTLAFKVASNAVCNSQVKNIAEGYAQNATMVSAQHTATVQCPDPKADLKIFKSGSATVNRGAMLLYTLTVQNLGPDAAKNIEVTDVVPSGLTYVAGQSSPECVLSSTKVVCKTSDLASGASKTYYLTFTVPQSAACNSEIQNKATVASTTKDSDMSNNESQIVKTKVLCEEVQVGCIEVKKETYDTNGNVLTPVAQFTFKLDGTTSAVNDSLGNAKFTNVPVGTHTVTEVVPTNWTQLSATPTNGVVEVKAGNTCSAVVFKNKQTLVQSSPTFTITKTDNRTTARAGETLTYSIVVTNTSGVQGTVTVRDTLPANVTYMSATNSGSLNGNIVTWNNISLNAGASTTLTVQIRINTGLSTSLCNSILTNVASIVGGTSATDNTTLECQNVDDDFDLEIEGNPLDLCIDDEIEYEIRLINDGNDDREVDVVAFLDADMEFVDASEDGDDVTDERIEWDNIDVDEDDETLLYATVRVDSRDVRDGDKLKFRVHVDGLAEDEITTRVIEDDCDTPTPGINLQIDKTADRTEAKPGSVVSYTITVRNDTHHVVKNAILDDSFSSSQLTIEDAGTGLVTGNGIRWSLGNLEPNTTTVIRYRARTSGNLVHGQVVPNTATVTAEGLSRSDTYQIYIVDRMPQTGMGGFSNGNDSLRELGSRNGSSTPALPLVTWFTVIFMGLGAGGVFGKKFFL